jgi:hypothetical protein
MKKQTYTLESLTLTNSDVFNKDIHITFDKKVTIVQSPNGGYKTTLFNAMKSGEWPYLGEFEFKCAENLSAPELPNLTYVDAEWLYYGLSEKIYLFAELNKSDFLKEIFLENLNALNNALNFKRYDIYNMHIRADPFHAFSISLATGEKTLLNIVYWSSIRKHLGIDGAIIIDGGLTFLDRNLQMVAYKMLTSMTNQLVIFGHSALISLEAENINLDAANIKIIDLDPKF